MLINNFCRYIPISVITMICALSFKSVIDIRTNKKAPTWLFLLESPFTGLINELKFVIIAFFVYVCYN